jgi:hypothetical protein
LLRFGILDLRKLRDAGLKKTRRSAKVFDGSRSGRCCDRQPKGKDRSLAKLACDINPPAVRLHNGFHDRQTHACSMHSMPLALAAVEFVENH